MAPRRRIGSEQLVARARRQSRQCAERRGNGARDIQERDLAGEKRRHRAFIGSVEHSGRRTTCTSRLDAGNQSRKHVSADRLERQWTRSNGIEAPDAANQ